MKNVSLAHPQAENYDFYRRFRFRQVIDCVRYDRRESQRLLNENFSTFVRHFLPRLPQPDADAIENLSMAVIVDQKRLGRRIPFHSGDDYRYFSHSAPVCSPGSGNPMSARRIMFSFNDPQGHVSRMQRDRPQARRRHEQGGGHVPVACEGAIMLPDYGVNGWEWNMIMQSGDFDPDKKLSDYTDDELDQLLYAKARKVKVDFGGKAMNITVEGVIEKFTNKYIKQDVKRSPNARRKRSCRSLPKGNAPAAAAPG